MQQTTIEQTANLAEKGGSVFAVFSGTLAFFNTNAAAIGAICAVCGVIIAFAGFLVNLYYQKKRTDLMRSK